MRAWRRLATAGLLLAVLAPGVPVGTAEAGPPAAAAACGFGQIKITARVEVSCRKARKIVQAHYGQGTQQAGWTCRAKAPAFDRGRCTNPSRGASLRWSPR